jgi:hypothetical protein
MPSAMASGGRRGDVGRRRAEGEHRAHGGGAGDEAEIARQVEQGGDHAALRSGATFAMTAVLLAAWKSW